MRITSSTSKAKALLIAATFALSLGTTHTWAEEILYNLESPVDGGAYFGIANLRGWAIAPNGIERVELYINGEYKSDIPMGASRGDVHSAHPNHANSAKSGFAMIYNYGNLDGTNQISVKIHANDGTVETINRTVTALKFGQDPYLNENAAFNYSNANFTTTGNQIQVSNMTVNGVSYNATLTWDQESQQFQFTHIN